MLYVALLRSQPSIYYNGLMELHSKQFANLDILKNQHKVEPENNPEIQAVT